MHSITEMISTEFTNAPVATIITLVTAIGTVFKLLINIKSKLVKPREGEAKTFENAGIPSSLLRFFMIPLSTKKIPEIKRLDKFLPCVFALFFIGSFCFSAPVVIRTAKTPGEHTLLIWKPTGEYFYISRDSAWQANIIARSKWSMRKAECTSNITRVATQSILPSPEVKKGICDLFLTQEGQRYLTNSIKVYPKEKTFVYVMLPFTELILLWITLGTILHVHFTKKLRKYIVGEHDKALSYV
ncbi:DUF6216 family protein [Cronobacter sakazakii]